MKKTKEEVPQTSDQKLYKLACELYYRTKGKTFVNGSQAMLGEYDEQGNRRTLAQVLKVSKAYGITTFIELGRMETEGGKKYTASTNVRWIGEAPTKEISKTLSKWCKDYCVKKAEEAAFRIALKQEEAEAELVNETVVETVAEVIVDGKPTVASKEEIYNMFVEAPVVEEEKPTPTPIVPVDRQTALQRFIQVEEERNVIEAQRNRILASMLTEMRKLNEAKIILGTEYSALFV